MAGSRMTTQEQPNSKSPAAIRMRRMREHRASRVTVIPAQEIGPEAVQALCNLDGLQKMRQVIPTRSPPPQSISRGLQMERFDARRSWAVMQMSAIRQKPFSFTDSNRADVALLVAGWQR